MTTDTREVTVRIGFGSCLGDASTYEQYKITLKNDGSDSILEVKQKLAAAAGGSVTPDDLLLFFSANDTKMGRQYQKDPSVDEAKITLAQYSVLPWLERFPHWHLSASLLPPTPPPPGEAIQRAAAVSKKEDPDAAVKKAITSGEIPKLEDLPAPWGPKPYQPTPQDGKVPKYPEGFSPLVDTAA
ncbi:hypothetical protein N2152v2_009251 [Parachlorella kessleri]